MEMFTYRHTNTDNKAQRRSDDFDVAGILLRKNEESALLRACSMDEEEQGEKEQDTNIGTALDADREETEAAVRHFRSLLRFCCRGRDLRIGGKRAGVLSGGVASR
jgi:hypothetical protein